MTQTADLTIGDYQYGFSQPEDYIFKARKGLNEEVVRQISAMKGEPEWMLEFRLRSYRHFISRPMPNWGSPKMHEIDFDNLYYYIKPTEEKARSWDDVPDDIKNTFDRLGVPEAEQKFLAGVGAQYESEVIYHNIKKDLENKGVLFLDTDQALQQHEDIFREYFGTIIPPEDNKFAALNSAVWSGGSFIYVPPGVKIDLPLQAYFRINAQNMGQFERTLIIVDKDAYVHYVEGCTAPTYSSDSLHSAVVEIIVKEGARCRYSTIQNWSTNVFNMVTKRAVAHKNATMEWVDGNLGCLAEGSTVTTSTGLKRIEDLEIGEQVLSLDETSGELCFQPVRAKRFSGHQPVMEVAYGERRLSVTANHPFYSYRYLPEQAKKSGRYRLDYIRADELTEAIIPCTSIDYGKPHHLAKKITATTFVSRNQYSDSFTATRAREQRVAAVAESTTDLMWLFGLFLGDGNIYRHPAQNGGTRYAKVGFSVPIYNRARAKLLQTIATLTNASPTKRADGIQLTWNSVELADLFEQNGFTGNARTKRIPEWVFSVPESQRLALLAGYLDSDGALIAPKRRFSIKSVNQALLKDTARLATTLGITARLYTEYKEARKVVIAGVSAIGHGSYRLEIPLDKRIFPFLSESFRERVEAISPAKLAYHRRIGRSNITLPPSLEVVKVSVGEASAKEVPTWDIEVAGTGNFISQGFIVHNSKLTMKYPAVWLMEPGAHGEVLSIAFAGKDQHQDAGAKIIHFAPNTSSVITSKSISKAGGRASYRGLLKVNRGAVNSKSNVVCDALILDDQSASDTFPYMEIAEDQVSIGHEASVTKVSEEQLFYLMSRGISEQQAAGMIVSGFIEPIVKELPMEYALEMNRLIELEMEGSVG